MITITFSIKSDGKFSSTKPEIGSSASIDPSEVAAFWQVFGNGGFEKDAKRLLERLCAEHGLDALQLLRGR